MTEDEYMSAKRVPVILLVDDFERVNVLDHPSRQLAIQLVAVADDKPGAGES